MPVKGTPKNQLSTSTVSRVRQHEYFLGIVGAGLSIFWIAQLGYL